MYSKINLHISFIQQHVLSTLTLQYSFITVSPDSFAEITATPPPAPTLAPVPNTNCKYLYKLGYTEDGVYDITLNNSVVQVYCQDGGWTVSVFTFSFIDFSYNNFLFWIRET